MYKILLSPLFGAPEARSQNSFSQPTEAINQLGTEVPRISFEILDAQSDSVPLGTTISSNPDVSAFSKPMIITGTPLVSLIPDLVTTQPTQVKLTPRKRLYSPPDISDVLDCQSDSVPFGVTINSSSGETTEQIVKFTDQNPAYTYTVDSQPDSTFGQADASGADLGDFFSRPVKISTNEWAIGTSFFASYDPWTDFFENPRIINRISNFKLLRCKMHVKIVINGNSFHYGRAIASYAPLPGADAFIRNRASFPQDIIAASQRPHVYLDPTTCQGGDLVLPFFLPVNAFNIPEMDWRNMGELNIRSINDLKHANGATDSVTISVFAWATDVTLSMPTSTTPGALTPQCSEEPLDCQADEYSSGPVSKPASIVAGAARAMTQVPIIGPYARATAMAASTVASIARLFGYSRPAIIADIMPYKPMYCGNLANCNVGDTSQRLTVDAKQELTIDPRTVGLAGEDELAIVPLAKRESYITKFPWAVATAPETLLWNTRVTPCMWATNVASTPAELHLTPSCWVAVPFKTWRGSMKFRFQIISSQYHKGRIKVVYDPYYPLTNEYNTNYTWIIDIAEQKDFTATIGWGSNIPYLNTSRIGISAVPFSTSAIGTPSATTSNGVLSVYVVNNLTVPNSSIDNDVEINVFTAMCDDFEVQNPDDSEMNHLTWFPTPPDTLASAPPGFEAEDELDPQSSTEEWVDPDGGEPVIRPISDKSDATLGAEMIEGPKVSPGVFYGENITSLRTMLKRYNFHTLFFHTGNTLNRYKRRQNNLPYHRGYAPGAIHTVGGKVEKFNRCKMTLVNWILPAYGGWRGSMRWKYVRGLMTTGDGSGNSAADFTMMVNRIATDTSGYGTSNRNIILSGTESALLKQVMGVYPSSHNGSAISVVSQNPVLEVELPYQSLFRFHDAKEADLTTTVVNDEYHDFHSCGQFSPGGGAIYETFCAIGEDFNVFFFTGVPICYNTGDEDPGA